MRRLRDSALTSLLLKSIYISFELSAVFNDLTLWRSGATQLSPPWPARKISLCFRLWQFCNDALNTNLSRTRRNPPKRCRRASIGTKLLTLAT